MSDQPILAKTVREPGRIVMYDAAVMPAPGPERFVATSWTSPILLDGGRGHTYAVSADFGDAVLRRYRRGGAVARALGDRYLWTGEAHARPLREFELLARASAAGLRVPRPLAAQVQRQGLFYTGDLMMARVKDALTVTARLDAARDWTKFNWSSVGNCIGRVHAAGFEHADLNAHNILIDAAARVWIIDWDNGVEHGDAGRAQGKASGQVRTHWPQRNLERLHRSLNKIFGDRMRADDAQRGWEQLLAEHARSLRTVPSAGSRGARQP